VRFAEGEVNRPSGRTRGAELRSSSAGSSLTRIVERGRVDQQVVRHIPDHLDIGNAFGEVPADCQFAGEPVVVAADHDGL